MQHICLHPFQLTDADEMSDVVTRVYAIEILGIKTL